jgi:hypothetical protein
MSLRIRRARASDFPGVLNLVESERPLFGDALWKDLSPLLADLLRRERVMLCVVEDADRGEVRFLGGSGFLAADVRAEVVEHPQQPALSRAFGLQRTRGDTFLNRRQIAEANRRGDLTLLNFFGTTHGLVRAGESLHGAASMATLAWTFFHAGFSFREIFVETADATQADVVRSIPARLVRHRPAPSGQATWLFQITREDALANPAGWPFGIMVSSPPRFGFTKQQQQVLELALLDFSDRQMLEALDLTGDSLKKRWRSIYRRAALVEPALFAAAGGADLRRALLQRLRLNLCELRPYR